MKYILSGTAQKQESRVKINVQLINALTKRNVWAKKFDEKAEDIFDLQGRIARAIAGEIGSLEGGVLAQEELDRILKSNPVSLKAYDLVLKAEHHRSRETREDS